MPLLLFLFLAIFDFARVFAASIAIESVAREAADYGSLYRWNWSTSPLDNVSTTEEEMERRACTAASPLTDYAEPTGTMGHATCTNPAFSYRLVPPAGATSIDCSAVPREADPCKVEVTLEYDFRVIVPIGISFFDTRLGLPDEVTFSRTSTFAVSDFEVDIEPVAP